MVFFVPFVFSAVGFLRLAGSLVKAVLGVSVVVTGSLVLSAVSVPLVALAAATPSEVSKLSAAPGPLAALVVFYLFPLKPGTMLFIALTRLFRSPGLRGGGVFSAFFFFNSAFLAFSSSRC